MRTLKLSSLGAIGWQLPLRGNMVGGVMFGRSRLLTGTLIWKGTAINIAGLPKLCVFMMLPGSRTKEGCTLWVNMVVFLLDVRAHAHSLALFKEGGMMASPLRLGCHNYPIALSHLCNIL